jgi:hypothetical protein
MTKTRKFIFGLVLSMFLVFIGVSVSGAVQYLGETIWNFTLTQNDKGATNANATLTGSITYMGGTYYTMQAYIILSDDGPVVFAGGGTLIGDILYLSMAGSQRHTEGSGNCDTDVIHMEINKDTLNGTFYAVGNDFNVNTIDYGDHFAAGTITLTGNSISLDASEISCSQSELDAAAQAEREKWDANGDGQIGLEEAVRALNIVSSIE